MVNIKLKVEQYFLACLFFCLSGFISLQAQSNALKNRFEAGIILGLNTTQINGDFLSGYDKFGGFAGIKALAKLSNTSHLVVELQYNRKGSKDPDRFVPGLGVYRSISLHYIEIPFLFQKSFNAKSIQYSLEGGLSYARLFGFDLDENPGTTLYNTFADIQNDFNYQDFALLVGGGVMLSDHVKLMTRFAYSLMLLYENENPKLNLPGDIPVINKLRNIQLAFGINYLF